MSNDTDHAEAPAAMVRTMAPPTNVSFEVSEFGGDMIAVSFGNHENTVSGKVMLEPDEAEELAEQISMEAKRVR